MTAIFISHSSADNAAAADMKAWLEAQGHTSLFLDFDPEAGIKGGAAWEQTLYQQLRQCQAVIALLTPSWLASKWCFAELVQARERGKAIFPVKVQPCDTGGVFSDIQHIDLTAQPEEGYKRLRIGLLERGLDPLDVFDWNPKRPPYPGLLAFQEADAAIFFGRGDAILKTLETLDGLRRQGREAARFGLLFGASGSGKSSLVRAGVIPRLKKKPAEWMPIPPFRPQLEPLDELAMALALAFAGYGRSHDWSVLRTKLHTAAARDPVDGLVLLNLARDLALIAHQPDTTVLLTIDQAEELFGYTPPEAATRFLRLLRATLEAADRRLMAVATLRSDFLGEFQNHPVLQDGTYAHHFRYQVVPVDPMPLRNFPATIQGPARLAGLQFEDGLVETIVHDTGTQDALLLLAFTLRRLYERYGDDGRLTVDEYESLGRLEGAIREEAQRVLAEATPPPEELEALHTAFVPTMVRINAEGGYARRRALLATMPHRAVPLLRRFVDARLLVTDRDSQGRETIEVAHEALLRTWPQLSSWLAEDRDKLRLLESLQRSAEEWDQGGRRDDLLIHRNGRLKDAEALLVNPRFTMPEASVERAYLIACSAAQQVREAAEKEEQERRIRDAERIAEEQRKAADAQKHIARRTRIGLFGVALVAVVAVWQYREAARETKVATARQQVALARQLAAQAERMRDQSPALLPRSVLLAIESLQRLSSPEANQALRQGLTLLRRQTQNFTHENYVIAVAFSPDGRYALSGSSDTTARVWEVATGTEVARMTHEAGVKAVAFSPDGRYALSGSSDTTARAWLWRSDELLAAACSRLTRNLILEEWRQYLANEPYRKTCQNLPIDPQFIQAGEDRAKAGDLEGAVTAFRRVREVDPSLDFDPETKAREIAVTALLKSGNKALQSGELDSAMTAFNQAIKLDPNSVNAYIFRGYVYAQKRDWDRALADYEQTVKLNPNSADAHHGRGLVYYQKGDLDQSVAAYTAALRLDQNSSNSHNNLAFVLFDLGRFAEAQQHWEEALRLSPDEADALAGKAIALEAQGNRAAALETYKLAVEKDKNYLDCTIFTSLDKNHAV